MTNKYDPSKDLTLAGGTYTPSHWADPVIPEAPDPNSPIGDMSNFRNNPALLRDIYKVYNARGVQFNNDDEAIKRWYSDMVWSLANTASAVGGDQGYLTATGIEDPEIRAANSRLRQAYHNMPSFYEEGGMGWRRGLWEWGSAAVTDPTNLLPLGWGAKAARAGYVASKAAGQPTKSLVGKRAAQGAAGEAALSGGVEAGLEYGTQATDVELGIRKAVDTGQVGQAALFGGVAGGIFGGLFAAVGAKMTTAQVNNKIEKLTGLGWKPEQIAAMVDTEANDIRWFNLYADNDWTPEDHLRSPADKRAPLGENEPQPNAQPTGPERQIEGPVTEYDDVHQKLNRRIHDAQENATTLEQDGVDNSVFIEERDHAQAVKNLIRGYSARKEEGEFSAEQAEAIEQAIIRATNSSDPADLEQLNELLKRPDEPEATPEPDAPEPDAPEATATEADAPEPDAPEVAEPEVDAAPLDRDPAISDRIAQWGEANVKNYATLRATRGGKAALRKIAVELNKQSPDDKIDTKLPKEELASAIEAKIDRVASSATNEADLDAQARIMDFVEDSALKETGNVVSFEVLQKVARSSPDAEEMLNNWIDETVELFGAHKGVDGDTAYWRSMADRIRQKADAVDESFVKPTPSKIEPIDAKRAQENTHISKQLASLPLPVRRAVRRTIDKRIEKSEQLREMFTGVEGESLGRVIEATRAYYRKIFNIPDDVSKLSFADIDPEYLPHIIELRDFARRAKRGKGKDILKDPIFESIRTRVINDEIDKALVKAETKGTPGSSSGRISTGIGITPGRAKRPTRTNIRRDWGGDGTKGLQAARAKAEVSNSTAPVPFVAAKAEKVTSERVQHKRKDGTPYAAPPWAKKKSKLWYDPITQKVWRDENYEAMLSARGEGKSDAPISEIGGGKVTRADLDKQAEAKEPQTIDVDDLAKKMAELLALRKAKGATPSGPTGRVKAILRRQPGVKERDAPKTFQARYFRVASKNQGSEVPLEKMVGKGDPSDWIEGTVPARYQGKVDHEALAEFVPDNPGDQHVVDRYSVTGFYIPKKGSPAPQPVKFVDVRDEMHDISDWDEDILRGMISIATDGNQEQIELALSQRRLSTTALSNIISNLEKRWPNGVRGLKTIGEEPHPNTLTGPQRDALVERRIRELITGYRTLNKQYPGGIVYGDATRQQAFSQIEDILKNDPRTAQAVKEVLDHLTRSTNDVAPKFAFIEGIEGDVVAMSINRMAQSESDRAPGDLSFGQYHWGQESDYGMTSTKFQAMVHEIMHWAYLNTLDQNERLHFWETVVAKKSDPDMATDSVFRTAGNTSDHPNEYWAQHASLYVEKRTPGALEESYWKRVFANTSRTIEAVLEFLQGHQIAEVDPEVTKILNRVLPDEFKSRLHESAQSQMMRDLKDYKFNRLTEGHAKRLIQRAWTLDIVEDQLKESLMDSADDVYSSTHARNLAGALLDLSHEKSLGGDLRRSIVALATSIFDVTDNRIPADEKTLSTAIWNTKGRVVEFDENNWNGGQWSDEGSVRINDVEENAEDYADWFEQGVIAEDGTVIDLDTFGMGIEDSLGQRIVLDQNGNPRDVNGDELDIPTDEADRWLAEQAANESATGEQINNLRAIFGLQNTKDVIKQAKTLLAQRWQMAANVDSNTGWIDQLPESMRDLYYKDEAGVPQTRTDRSHALETARRKSKKVGATYRKRADKTGEKGGYSTRDMDDDELLRTALDKSDPKKAKDAHRELWARVAENKTGRKDVEIPPSFIQMKADELLQRLGELNDGPKTKAARSEMAQILSEVRRRAAKKLAKRKAKATPKPIIRAVRDEMRDIGEAGLKDGIPPNVRPHLNEVLLRVNERTPEQTSQARTLAYRIMNVAHLSDPSRPISNEHMAKLSGEPLNNTPHKPLSDFADPAFRSFRNQVRKAIKEKDGRALAEFALRADVLDPTSPPMIALRASFDSNDAILDRWVAYAKEHNRPFAGVSDDMLAEVQSAMDDITATVSYMMDGIDSLESLYGSFPRLADHADPLSALNGSRSRNLYLMARQNKPKSVAQGYAHVYAQDLLRSMSLRAKDNLAAFAGRALSKTPDGVTPYFVRSNGTATIQSEVRDFGEGIYASTHAAPYDKSLRSIVVEHLTDAEASPEKIDEAGRIAVNLSSVRANIRAKRAFAEWHNLSNSGVPALLAQEKHLAKELRDLTGNEYDQVTPIVCNCERYADFSHTSSNLPDEWLISEFMKAAIQGDRATSVTATGELAKAMNSRGDRGKALYNAFWRTIANGDIADESAAKSRTNEILQDLGYDGIKFTGSHKVPGGQDTHVEYMIFDRDSARRLDDSHWEDGEVLELTSPTPNYTTPVSPIVNDILSGGDGRTVSVGEQLAELRGVANLLDSIRSRGAPSPENVIEGFRKGPVYYLRKGSARLRKYGDKYISDFLQKENGTGIFERVDNEIGRKLMPIIRALNELPGTGNTVQRWFKRSLDVRHRSNPTEAENRVIMALRTGEEEWLTDPAEPRAYQRIRETLDNEKDALIHYGIMHGGIAENYVPQIWSAERLRKNTDRAVEKLADYFVTESLARDEMLPRERAQDIARRMIRNITDDNGVHLPPQYATKNEPGLDHVDYQRMIQLHRPEFRQNLMALSEFLENDISSILAKYLDGSTRKIEYAKRFGVNNHAALMYMRILENGPEAAQAALLRPREMRRTIRGVVDGEVETMQRTDQIPAPFGENQVGAQALLNDVMDAIKNPQRGGTQEAEQILKNPDLFSFRLSDKKQFQWDRRAEAIVAGLENHSKGAVAPSEVKVMEDLLLAGMRKPVGDSHFQTAMRPFSKFMRNFNALTMLSFTTVTSLTDPFIPLLRSGEVGAWVRGMRKYAADPDYREMMRDSGLSIENYVHNRLVGLYGADASKLTTAFFNATMLSPWTDSMREMAGIIGFEWFKTEQRRIAKHGLNSRAGRKAKRVLERYGLSEFATEGAVPIENLVKSRRHIGAQYDESIDPEFVLQSNVMRDALVKFANDTIFAPNTNDVPLWAQTPAGAMVWQLKSFPMMMARLSKDSIMEIVKDPTNLHSYKPLTMLAVMGPAGGSMAIAAKDIIQMRGDEDQGMLRDRHGKNINWLKAVGYNPDLHGDPNDFAGWYVEGLMHMGGFGLYLELLHNVVEQADNGMYGYSRAMSNIAGPTVSQTIGLWNLGSGLHNMVLGDEGDPNGKGRQAARELVQRVPVVGGIKAVKESLVDAMAGEPTRGKKGRYAGPSYGGAKYGGSKYE